MTIGIYALMATSKGPPPPGSIWTQRTTSQTSGWFGSGISANGKYSIINGSNYAGNDGYVLYSKDFGVTWNQATSGENALFTKGSCVSDNGAIMAYTSSTGTIQLSTNGGLTFSAVGPTSPTIKEWGLICCSSDGSIMYAYDVGNAVNLYQGAIYKSINSGATWSNIGSPASAILTGGAIYYNGICCSPDGTKVAVSVYNWNNIWISTNSGSTWASNAPNGGAQGGSGFYNVSANQTSLLAVDTNNALLYSPDWGTTWAQVASNGSLWRSAISRDGSLVLYTNNSRIYVSKNIGLTGTTFTAVGPTGTWNTIACSSNGNVIIAGSSGSYVYSSP